MRAHGAYLRFISAPRTLLFKVGTSFTSWRPRATTSRPRSRIRTSPRFAPRPRDAGIPHARRDRHHRRNSAQHRVFYLALPRHDAPRIVSDADAHPHFASSGRVESHRQPYYDDFSLWDIYRAQLPLSILDPPSFPA